MNLHKKTAGILSMQKEVNYGSFLQAYALKQLLLHNGIDEVYFIDIIPGKQLPGFERKKIEKGLLAFVKRVLYVLFSGKLVTKIKDRNFTRKYTKNIVSSYPVLGLDKEPLKEIDIVIIGSDEVFNCCQVTDWGYTTQLYGDIPEIKQIISYAGSFGHTTYEQLLDYNIDQEIGKTMKKMSAISVRDQNSCQIVEKITGIKPEVHLDPVLIYGYENEIAVSKTQYPEPYVIIYSYPKRINDKNEIKEMVTFAKSKNLKLVSIFCRHDWCDKLAIPDTPIDVLAWFKGAQYVITDTFHGSVFSIITKRNFCTIIRNGNSQKITSLLQTLNLEDRIITSQAIAVTLDKSIHYSPICDIIEREKQQATAYLRKQCSKN